MKSLTDWESEVEKTIREAMEQGKFDDLKGKGKPQNLGVNPYLDPADEMAFKVLQDAGYAPDWIEDDKTLRAEIEKARADLARAWAYRQERLATLALQSGPAAEAARARCLLGGLEAEAPLEYRQPSQGNLGFGGQALPSLLEHDVHAAVARWHVWRGRAQEVQATLNLGGDHGAGQGAGPGGGQLQGQGIALDCRASGPGWGPATSRSTRERSRGLRARASGRV